MIVIDAVDDVICFFVVCTKDEANTTFESTIIICNFYHNHVERQTGKAYDFSF